MRLIEEFEGKKPPYGYLLLGPKCRKVKIENSDTRQQWLQNHLDQMRSILAGMPSKPTPHPRKCGKCAVRHVCQHSLHLSDNKNLSLEKKESLKIVQISKNQGH
jgi:CRISPR/Cas system-associated exonuclease Cas4 (RecB family)